jgi:hypothetical protein
MEDEFAAVGPLARSCDHENELMKMKKLQMGDETKNAVV